MNAKINSSIFGSARRQIAAGLMALTILAARAEAQYVSTLISNSLNQPYGVTVDGNNTLYISDTVNNRIAAYATAATNTTLVNLAGLPGPSYQGTNNGTGTAARFNNPSGIVYARGGLVVADQGNQELRYVSLAGVVTNLAGTPGITGSNNGPALGGAQFNYPSALAVGSDGATIYIVDQQNQSIRVLTSGNMVSNLNLGGYQFHGLSAIAVDLSNNVYAADAADQVICLVSNGTTQVIAGTLHNRGTNDSPAVGGAQFNAPNGLFWDRTRSLLVISDTHNQTVRSLYLTNISGVSSYYVHTIAGTALAPGFVDGALGTAEFDYPLGICVDLTDSGYYVADSMNNSIRIVQPTKPAPPPSPVPDPTIGYLTFPLVNGVAGSHFNPITNKVSIFNNTIPLTIEQTDGTVLTYVTYGPTGTVIPDPQSGSQQTAYTPDDDGLPSTTVPVLNTPIIPDLTIETISTASGRSSSDIVSAEIQYVTANPQVFGQDPSDITISDTTTGAQMYYTLDGTTPTNDGTAGIGPIYSGTKLVLAITNDTVLKVRAFNPGFSPSGVVSASLLFSNLIGNQMTFGFITGNSSSKFRTSAGRYFYAPVTLTLLEGATMYSLQFNLNETNLPGAPVIDNSLWQFQSFLRQPTNINGATFLAPINPDIVITNAPNYGGYTNVSGQFTNDNLMGVGYIEIYPETNLYDTTSQDLITYSEAHDEEFTEAEGKVVVGAFGFPIPLNAPDASQYQITIGLPSASTFQPPGEIAQAVYVRATSTGSLTNGAINAIKDVTVGTSSYLVGDAYPFSWLNAGDFGDSILQNSDVIEVFQTAIYNLEGVPFNSDFFDAMDSSDGSYNNLYDSSDTAINNIKTGDGKLLVDDVYVTFKRSLDTNLNWYVRNWNGGVETVTTFTNFAGIGAAHAASQSVPAAQPASGNPVYVTVAGDQVQGSAGNTVQVPVRLWLANTNYPLRVMMFDVSVEALDGSPDVTSGVTFNASSSIGSPTLTSSQKANEYGAAWLNSSVAGVTGTNVVGTVSVTLPANATANSAYRVHFNSFSASPNGLALFNSTVQDGLITVGDRSGSSWNDGIPDSWRLINFGTVSNALSAATADADGDGASNWAEYIAGTNPNDALSAFKFMPGAISAPTGFTLQWTSAINKHYTVQTCYNLAGGVWKTLATNIAGTGQPIQWTDANASGKIQYYRAMVQ